MVNDNQHAYAPHSMKAVSPRKSLASLNFSTPRESPTASVDGGDGDDTSSAMMVTNDVCAHHQPLHTRMNSNTDMAYLSFGGDDTSSSMVTNNVCAHHQLQAALHIPTRINSSTDTAADLSFDASRTTHETPMPATPTTCSTTPTACSTPIPTTPTSTCMTPMPTATIPTSILTPTACLTPTPTQSAHRCRSRRRRESDDTESLSAFSVVGGSGDAALPHRPHAPSSSSSGASAGSSWSSFETQGTEFAIIEVFACFDNANDVSN